MHQRVFGTVKLILHRLLGKCCVKMIGGISKNIECFQLLVRVRILALYKHILMSSKAYCVTFFNWIRIFGNNTLRLVVAMGDVGSISSMTLRSAIYDVQSLSG